MKFTLKGGNQKQIGSFWVTDFWMHMLYYNDRLFFVFWNGLSKGSTFAPAILSLVLCCDRLCLSLLSRSPLFLHTLHLFIIIPSFTLVAILLLRSLCYKVTFMYPYCTSFCGCFVISPSHMYILWYHSKSFQDPLPHRCWSPSSSRSSHPYIYTWGGLQGPRSIKGIGCMALGI